MRSHSLVVVISLMAFPLHLAAQTLPVVGSGTLVAHFHADATTVATDANGNVLSWTAANNNSIVLTGMGTPVTNIKYVPTGMNGNPTVEVSDFSGQDRVLFGAIPGTRTATTIFWLGYFSPGRNGSVVDDVGQYVYSYGADGADGSQLDFQIDNGRAELYSGGGTQTGGFINGLNGQYTVWRVVYGSGAGNGHAAIANKNNLSLPATNGGNYSVSGNLNLFGFQGTGGAPNSFNFVGNLSVLLIYDGILNAADALAIERYLSCVAYPCDCSNNGTPDACDVHACATCPGDLNGDSSLDGRDVDGFVDLLLSPAPVICADMNQSGGPPDSADLDLFICNGLCASRPCI